MGLSVTKPVFGVSGKARLKPVSSTTENSLKSEISLEASLDMILSKKMNNKGADQGMLFAAPETGFSCRGPYGPCLLLHANNKCADQPAHSHSLISTFVISSLESILS